MRTIKVSPKAALRAMFGAVDRPTGRRTGDWLTLKDGTPVKLGLRVYHESQPRFIGRIEKIINSAYASIRWENGCLTGALTEAEKISELVAASDEEE